MPQLKTDQEYQELTKQFNLTVDDMKWIDENVGQFTPSASKPFSQTSYNQNDEPAKLKIEEIIQGKSFTIVRPDDRYAVDLNVYRNGKHVGNFETEVKHGWTEERYPFVDVRFPYRKKKFCELTVPTVFVMFNHDLSHHLCVKDKTLLASPLSNVTNKEMANESFFVVSLKNVIFDWLYSWN